MCSLACKEGALTSADVRCARYGCSEASTKTHVVANGCVDAIRTCLRSKEESEHAKDSAADQKASSEATAAISLRSARRIQSLLCRVPMQSWATFALADKYHFAGEIDGPCISCRAGKTVRPDAKPAADLS